MTDRIRYLTVALEEDVRDDEPSLGRLIVAIGQMRGVLEVKTGNAQGADWTTEARVRRELAQKLFDIGRETLDQNKSD